MPKTRPICPLVRWDQRPLRRSFNFKPWLLCIEQDPMFRTREIDFWQWPAQLALSIFNTDYWLLISGELTVHSRRLSLAQSSGKTNWARSRFEKGESPSRAWMKGYTTLCSHSTRWRRNRYSWLFAFVRDVKTSYVDCVNFTIESTCPCCWQVRCETWSAHAWVVSSRVCDCF